MTKMILSSVTGGVTLHGRRPIAPWTASAKNNGTKIVPMRPCDEYEKKRRKEEKII